MILPTPGGAGAASYLQVLLIISHSDSPRFTGVYWRSYIGSYKFILVCTHNTHYAQLGLIIDTSGFLVHQNWAIGIVKLKIEKIDKTQMLTFWKEPFTKTTPYKRLWLYNNMSYIYDIVFEETILLALLVNHVNSIY